MLRLVSGQKRWEKQQNILIFRTVISIGKYGSNIFTHFVLPQLTSAKISFPLIVLKYLQLPLQKCRPTEAARRQWLLLNTLDFPVFHKIIKPKKF